MAELKPCPFCGNEMHKYKHADDCYFTLHAAISKAPDGDLSLIPDVLDAWNRRADKAAGQDDGQPTKATEAA
jgi:hypothetical protein